MAQVDHLLAFASKAEAMAQFGDQLEKAGDDWARDHVFEARLYLSTTTTTTTHPVYGPRTYEAPNYDSRYWVLLALDRRVTQITNRAECFLAWDRDVGTIYRNRFTAAEFAAVRADGMPLGSAYWLGKAVV